MYPSQGAASATYADMIAGKLPRPLGIETTRYTYCSRRCTTAATHPSHQLAQAIHFESDISLRVETDTEKLASPTRG